MILLSYKQKNVQLGVIYFKRQSVFKIWYLRYILNYPTHFHDHVTLTLRRKINSILVKGTLSVMY